MAFVCSCISLRRLDFWAGAMSELLCIHFVSFLFLFILSVRPPLFETLVYCAKKL